MAREVRAHTDTPFFFCPSHMPVRRSPWSNTYTPPIDDAQFPSDQLRSLEVLMNDAFDTYREM